MKILYLTPESDWFIQSVKNTLEKMGHTVDLFKYKKMQKILGRVYPFPFLYQIGAYKSNNKLKEQVKKSKPDLILTTKGEIIFPQTIEWIKKKFRIPCVLWFPDDPQLFYRVSRYIAPAYDYVFTSSVDMIPKYREIGVENVDYISFACDPSLHKKIFMSNEEKRKYKSDICFVGKFNPEREKIFRFILDYDFKIYGPYWYFSDKEIRMRWTRMSISGEDVVKVFNASKIVINVHDNEMKYGGMKANSRIFETTGCGTFLFTDKPKGIGDLFRLGKEIVCFENKNEMLELIKFYLENKEEREKIALNGQKRAYRDHTFEKRLNKILLSV